MQIACDEGCHCHSLLPLLMHAIELQGSTVQALLQSFKITVRAFERTPTIITSLRDLCVTRDVTCDV